MEAGSFPTQLKMALVTPRIKKPSLDSAELKNYRPVSNLSFLSKTIERAVASRLREYLTQNQLQDPFQSAYRPLHSTETALVKVSNDILIALDQRKQVLLLLLDLSAAFDTVDHHVLLTRLNHDMGLNGVALSWFKSYLSDRCQAVHIDGATSKTTPLHHGVPQGSVMGPLLFTLYTRQLGKLISEHNCIYHLYADDCQLLQFNERIDDPSTLQQLHSCLEAIISWMSVNKLKLNMGKTEALAISPSHQQCFLDNINIGAVQIKTSDVVRNLGTWFDKHMTLNTNVSKTCAAAYMALRKISAIRQYLDKDSTIRLVQAYVTSRLDYNNSLLVGLPDVITASLQRVQNTAARLICKVPKFHHITPSLIELHWLPIKQRIIYKTLVLTYKSTHNEGPQYLADLLHVKQPSRQLRSSNQRQLIVPRVRTVRYGERSFAFAAPRLWNGLEHHVHDSTTIHIFKKSLKTILFKRAYDVWTSLCTALWAC